ncbi:MAG TPA: hypothetical protein PLX89_24345, partial [Verrucomicrobiota bacterium]|nr:hypothetical protein [Verrucomicrobiota bacterium]
MTSVGMYFVSVLAGCCGGVGDAPGVLRTASLASAVALIFVWLMSLDENVRKRLTSELTDRRRKRALTANPVPDEPARSNSNRGAAVRSHDGLKRSLTR